MLSASSVSKQTEDVLETVLKTIREEYEGPYSVLCETDRNKYVEEEESLRMQLKEAKESESNCSSWRGLLGLPSSPVSKCFKDAQELLQRVREDINSRLRTRLSGKSILPPPSIHGQDSARAPGQDGGHPLAEGNSEPDNALITSPLNMHCSLSEPGASEVDGNVNPPVQNEMLNETSDGNSSGRHHRRSPPPPPLRQKVLSSNSRLSPETSSDSGSDSPRRSPSVRRSSPPPPRSPSNSRPLSEISNGSGSDSPRRSPSVRRPAPPPPWSPSNSRPLSEISSGSRSDSPRRSPSVRRPAPPPPQSPSTRPVSAISSDSGSDSPRHSPSVRRFPPSPLHSTRQSRTPPSPGNTFFLSPSPGSPPLDPAMMSSISMITQQMNALASSLAADSSRGVKGKSRRNDYVIKENCLEISGSNVDGVTMNNDSNNCSGAVIHKTMMPPHMRQQVPPF